MEFDEHRKAKGSDCGSTRRSQKGRERTLRKKVIHCSCEKPLGAVRLCRVTLAGCLILGRGCAWPRQNGVSTVQGDSKVRR